MRRLAARSPQALLLVATAFWGASFLVTRLGVASAPPLPFVAVRFLTASAAVALVTRPALGRTTRAEAKGAAFIGLAMLAGYGLQAAGLETLSAGRSAFISALYVPMVPVLQILVLRRLPRALIWVSVALAAAGMVLLAGPDDALRGGLHGARGRGEAATLGAACAIAAEITLAGIFAPLCDPRQLATLQCGLIGVAAAALSGFGRVPAPGIWTLCALTLGVLSAFLQLSVNAAMRTVTATRATLIFATEPVWAALFGMLAGERFTMTAAGGAALILLALLISGLSR